MAAVLTCNGTLVIRNFSNFFVKNGNQTISDSLEQLRIHRFYCTTSYRITKNTFQNNIFSKARFGFNFRLDTKVMGRTFRSRSRNKKVSRKCNISHEEYFINFMKWLTHNGWSSECELTPVEFPGTGRGLMALRPIKEGEILVKIPQQLLITSKTVSLSGIGSLFSCEKSFSTQQVLASFIVWEKHIGESSKWKDYINLLPPSFSSPLFCNDEELVLFPSFVRNVINISLSKFESVYNDMLNILAGHLCKHCGECLSTIYTESMFKWAWFIVNSRAVYISPTHNVNNEINLYDDNSLALAPYLDLINHSNSAKVQAYLLEDEGSYCLKTFVSYNKYEEVYIHYGSHSNINLFVEYGFLLKDNANESLPIDFSNIQQAVTEYCEYPKYCSSTKYKLLQSHGMLSHLSFNQNGLSWNSKVVIFILLISDSFDIKSIYKKVFSEGFSAQELNDISKIGEILVNKKINENSQYIKKLQFSKTNEENRNIILLGMALFEEYSKMLDKSKSALKNLDI